MKESDSIRATNDFDGIAGHLSARVMAWMNADMERAALAMAGPADHEHVIVVGFGPGIGLVALLDRVTPASVIAVDPSRAMMRAAQRRLAGHRHAQLVELRAVPASEITGPAIFDVAIAVNTEQLWDPHRASVQAVSDVLRPGGRFVSLTHAWAITKRQTLSAWRALVEADVAASSLETPVWSESRYRSGPAVRWVARKR
jgi:arsenite methyltransferase